MAHTESSISHLSGMFEVQNSVVSILGVTKPAENGFGAMKACIDLDEDNGNKGKIAQIQIVPSVAVALYYHKVPLLNEQHFARARGYFYQQQIFIDAFKIAGLTVELLIEKGLKHNVCTFGANLQPLPGLIPR